MPFAVAKLTAAAPSSVYVCFVCAALSFRDSLRLLLNSEMAGLKRFALGFGQCVKHVFTPVLQRLERANANYQCKECGDK